MVIVTKTTVKYIGIYVINKEKVIAIEKLFSPTGARKRYPSTSRQNLS
jgi:hypothetical protein